MVFWKNNLPAFEDGVVKYISVVKAESTVSSVGL